MQEKRAKQVKCRSWLPLAACLFAAGVAAYAVAASAQSRVARSAFPGRLPITELTEEQAIRHALNRLAFGPRPGDVERVQQMGLENWIEQQLNPQRIDDSALEARLTDYPTLKLSSTELIEQYPPPQQAARRAGMTPEQISQLREQLQGRQQGGANSRRDGASPPDEMQPGDGTDSMGEPMNEPMTAMGPAQLRQQIPPELANLPRPQQIIQELAAAKMTRAIYSERQLEAVLADFWFNHFNVFAGKNADRWLLTSYERDTIRPHVLGKFEDLLVATAQSPAMLVYLDNFQSVDPEAFERMQQQMQQRVERLRQRFGRLGLERRGFPGGPTPEQVQQRLAGQKRGLNENYARELMELHTLGVDGGYTQDDVIAVAKVFTGWTVRQPRRNPEFYFESRLHDPNPQVVLGKKITAKDIEAGEQVLDLLARHPSTARFISAKLAGRFVSDEPPKALVDRMAEVFAQTDGDIRTVLRAMIYSPEFWSREAYRAKIKKPFELVASTVRAVGADTDQMLPLVQWTARIGEPLYQCQPPTGYSDKAEAWVNTGALLNRMNFAMAVAGNARRFGGGSVQALAEKMRGATPDEALSHFADLFLAGEVSPQSLETLKAKLESGSATAEGIAGSGRGVGARWGLAQVAGLVLGSPEFQRR